MAKQKSTKRALLLSALSLLMCVSMLIGSTFAWFTDEVISGKNLIQSGNLDVKLSWSTDASTWEEVTADTNVFEDKIWEPGHTEVVYLKLENAGSLALKYNLGVNIVSETGGTNVADEPFKLSNYIKFDVIEIREGFSYPDRKEAVAAVADTAKSLYYGFAKDGTMTKEGDVAYVAMVVYMPETVGNEANHKTDTDAPSLNLGINLVATQLTYESDSFDDQYDADALICDVLATPDTLTEVLAAAEEGDVIGLANQGFYAGVITIPVNNLTLVSNGALVDSIDLNGKDGITIDGLKFDPSYATIAVTKYDQPNAAYVETGYRANITNTTSTPYGADDIVIKNCTFIEGYDFGYGVYSPDTYCAIAIEDAGRVSGSTTNLTVENCTFNAESFEHLRLNYIGGDIVIKNNTFLGATKHHNINASGNKGNWTIIGNSFSNWADGEYAFGTSRNGSHKLTLTIEGNSFTKAMAADTEIPVLSIKSSYTADNSIVVVENNIANAGAATIDATIREDYKYYMYATSSAYSFTSPADAGVADALKEENATVFLGNGDYGKINADAIGAGATIIGNGETTFATHQDALDDTKLENVTFIGVNFSGNNASYGTPINGTVTFEDCTLTAHGAYIHFQGGSAAGDKLVFNNCTLTGWCAFAASLENIEFNGCTFKGNGTYGTLRTYQDVTVTDCVFDYSNVTDTTGISPAQGTVTLVNCTNANGTLDNIIDADAPGNIVK